MGCLGSRQMGRGFIYMQSRQQSISGNPLDLFVQSCRLRVHLDACSRDKYARGKQCRERTVVNFIAFHFCMQWGLGSKFVIVFTR